MNLNQPESNVLIRKNYCISEAKFYKIKIYKPYKTGKKGVIMNNKNGTNALTVIIVFLLIVGIIYFVVTRTNLFKRTAAPAPQTEIVAEETTAVTKGS